MDPEYYNGGMTNPVTADIVSQSLNLAEIRVTEFTQQVDLVEDNESRWAQASQYEIMHE